MILYRFAKIKYAKDLSGRGAELAGGRWNSKGTRMVYCSESRSLAALELRTHIIAATIPSDYQLITIEIPERVLIQHVNTKLLPADWRSFPHSNSTQQIGDKFIAENKYLLLKVPSAIIPEEFNYLINPAHREAGKIKFISIETYQLDTRIF